MGKAGGQTDQLAWTAFATFQDRQFEDRVEGKCLDSPMKTAAFQEDTFLVEVLPEKVGGGPEVAQNASPPKNQREVLSIDVEANKWHFE